MSVDSSFGRIGRCIMDVLTPEQRSRNMKAIRNKGTKMEVLLAKALWAKGLRYRKNDPSVYGKPDISFRQAKVAVFVDSEYFHGKNWETEKYRIKTNREFWWAKIEGNIARDKQVNKYLSDAGWIVMRFWSHEIRKDLESCVLQIESVIRSKRS